MASDSRPDVRLTADVEHRRERAPREVRQDRFSVVVLADLGGHTRPSDADAVPLRSFVVDRDNFDDVLSRTAPSWRGRLAGSDLSVDLSLRFASMDDFHPDALVRRVSGLSALATVRRELLHPETFNAAAAQARRLLGADRPPAGEAPPAKPSAVARDDAGLLDLMVETEQPEEADASAEMLLGSLGGGAFDRFVRKVAEPYAVTLDAREQTGLVGAVDQVLSALIASILQDPQYQNVEAAWRGLLRLVSAIDDDTTFRVRVVDCPRERLDRMLDEEPAGDAGPLATVLAADGHAPALVLCAHQFQPDAEGLSRLARLADLAADVGTPLVASAGPDFLGQDTFARVPEARELSARLASGAFDAWRAVRRQPAAGLVALVLPRVLSRLPYGAKTDPVDTWHFEEDPPPHQHERLLWESGVFAVGALVAQVFAEAAWDLDLATTVRELEGLPVYVYDRFGERAVVPPAEAWLNDSHVAVLEANGLTPLVSHRHAGTIAVRALQAIAEPRVPLPLAGA